MKAQELQEKLYQQLLSMTSSDDWKRMLRAASQFHDYSMNNLLLITMQNPDATRVAGYTTWLKFHRYVRKGEKGIKILAPMVKKNDDGDKVIGFRVVHVFDISQTEGEDILELPLPVLLEGEAPGGLIESIMQQIKDQGFTVELQADWAWGETRGYTNFQDHQVAIDGRLSDAQIAKTLCHELAHVLLHPDVDYPRHQGRSEVEAESTAYIVATSAGLSTEGYSLPYIASWSEGDMKLVLKTATRVVETANQIIKAYEAGRQLALPI